MLCSFISTFFRLSAELTQHHTWIFFFLVIPQDIWFGFWKSCIIQRWTPWLLRLCIQAHSHSNWGGKRCVSGWTPVWLSASCIPATCWTWLLHPSVAFFFFFFFFWSGLSEFNCCWPTYNTAMSALKISRPHGSSRQETPTEHSNRKLSSHLPSPPLPPSGAMQARLCSSPASTGLQDWGKGLS